MQKKKHKKIFKKNQKKNKVFFFTNLTDTDKLFFFLITIKTLTTNENSLNKISFCMFYNMLQKST